MSRGDEQEREFAFWLACAIDEATPLRSGERGLLDRLRARHRVAEFVESWTGVAFLISTAAIAAFAHWSTKA